VKKTLMPPAKALSATSAAPCDEEDGEGSASPARKRARSSAGSSTAAGAHPVLIVPTAAEVAARRQRLQQQAAEGQLAVPRPAAPFELPPVDRVADFLRALVARDGLSEVARLLFRFTPRERLQQVLEMLCDEAWGMMEELSVESSLNGFNAGNLHGGLVEVGGSARECIDAGRSPATVLVQRARPLSSDVQSPLVYRHVACFACETPEGLHMPTAAHPCRAQEILATLADEMSDCARELVEAENEAREQLGDVRRSYRYFLYRKFVQAGHGELGPRVRVRIPQCVVEEIRHAFRAPGCECLRGGPLAVCSEHGYTGHKDVE
jgi:hypothetical protein